MNQQYQGFQNSEEFAGAQQAGLVASNRLPEYGVLGLANHVRMPQEEIDLSHKMRNSFNSSTTVLECHPSIKLPDWVGWNEQTTRRMMKIGDIWYVV